MKPNTQKTDIISVMSVMESLYQRSLGPEKDKTLLFQLVLKLTNLTPQLRKLGDLEIAETLFRYWLHYYEDRLQELGDPDYQPSINDSFIQLASQYKLASTLEPSSRTAQTLGCVCLARVAMAANGERHPRQYHVGKLLSEWLGRPIDKKTLESVEATVNVLYGPAAWALYRPDMELDGSMPWYLWGQGVPLKGPQIIGIDAGGDMEMPGDMIG